MTKLSGGWQVQISDENGTEVSDRAAVVAAMVSITGANQDEIEALVETQFEGDAEMGIWFIPVTRDQAAMIEDQEGATFRAEVAGIGITVTVELP